MNEPSIVEWGIATSAPQAEVPTPSDFEFIQRVTEILDSNPPKTALEILLGKDAELPNFITPLSEIGLNHQAIINLIKTRYKKGEYEQAIELLRSIADIRVFGLDNEIVFDKYIEVLKLFGFKFFRFSINWDKCISPEMHLNMEEINNYKYRARRLIDAGIEPIITFSHFQTLGVDIHSEGFEKLFIRFSAQVLESLVPQGIKYWIAFNEPAVHSGGLNLGFWGPGKMGPINFYNHFKTLNRIGYLSKLFYKQVHNRGNKYEVGVKVIANFNVALFDPGTAPTFFDNQLIYWSNRIDKNAQIDPYKFDTSDEDKKYPFVQKGKSAYDIIALNPYQIYNFATVNKYVRKFTKNLVSGMQFFTNPSYTPEEVNIDSLVPDLSNPDFQDPNETRVGSHGQILYPKAIGIVAKNIAEEFDIKDMVVTESGADINASTPEGIKNKVWYAHKAKEEIERLSAHGIKVPFALIWTLFNMWEILGPEGGGIGMWGFGILGQPISRAILITGILESTSLNKTQATIMAEKIERSGNMPLEIFDSMLKNLGEIFNKKISVEGIVDALVIRLNPSEVLTDIVQLSYLRKYYEKLEDERSVEYINAIQCRLREKFEKESTIEIPRVDEEP